jgi:hypothetical protein
VEVESVNSKTDSVEDDDGGDKSKGGVKVKRYHDGQFLNIYRSQNCGKLRPGEDLSIKMKTSALAGRWTENAVAN